MDIDANNSGGARAIGYQLIRHGITTLQHPPSVTSFIGLMSVKRIHLSTGTILLIILKILKYQNEDHSTLRVSSAIKIPINSDPAKTNTFSLAINILEFGVRAYVVPRTIVTGAGDLIQIFPHTQTKILIFP